MSLARRSVTSAAWNIGASLASLAVAFGRSVLLARLLPVDTFGAYALATSIVGLSVLIPNFGMTGAFLHRASETENESEAAAVHFTLKLIFTAVWAVILGASALLFTRGPIRTALLVLAFAVGGIHLTQTPRLILTRRVRHKRLALLDAAKAPLTSVVAILLAWRGATLWALLATDLATLALAIYVLFGHRPVWRPQLSLSLPTVRYFLSFGSRGLAADILHQALDRVDNLWTGLLLGQTPLGFYSRAYTFATYPRQLLASPINAVASGTYAELKGDRRRLSQAFFRANAFLVRSGFLLAGMLALVAPEFIRIFLTTKWLPMLDAFRLMLIFTLLDPIKATVANLYVAVGQPGAIVRVRLVQLGLLVAGLMTLGPALGITGVALAVDIMLVSGIVLLLGRARQYVDFSASQMFLVPGVALTAGMLLARASLLIPGVLGSPWRTGVVKVAVFLPIYASVLLLLERGQTMKMLSALADLELWRPWNRSAESD